MVSGLRKDANLKQGLAWGKHCPGATSAPENSSESLWEGPESALPVLCSPYLRSPFLCRPPRVIALSKSRHPESPELKSLALPSPIPWSQQFSREPFPNPSHMYAPARLCFWEARLTQEPHERCFSHKHPLDHPEGILHSITMGVGSRPRARRLGWGWGF